MTVADGRPVLVLNAGSSSLKFAPFCGRERRYHGQVDGIGEQPRFVSGQAASLWVIAADEERAILRHVRAVLAGPA